MISLNETFKSLSPANGVDEHAFVCQPIEAYSDRYVGADCDGLPVVLLKASRTETMPRSYRLKNLSLIHHVKCTIRFNDKEEQSVLSVLRCGSSEEATQEFFLRVAERLISLIPREPTSNQVGDILGRLAQLFADMKEPPRMSVGALWAELFCIVEASSPTQMAKGWHNDLNERADFSDSVSSLEVKSSSSRDRRHFFSLEQVFVADDFQALVASIFVERQTGGISLGEMMEMAIASCSGDIELQLKIESGVVSTLGTLWSESRGISFDVNLARDSIQYYDIQSIPKPSSDMPVGVSEVKFRSDLSLAAPWTFENTNDLSPLIASIPRHS